MTENVYDTAKDFTLLTINGATVKKKVEHTRNKYMNILNEVMFTKISVKAEIKKFAETAIAAMFKEFNQSDKGAIPRNPVVIPIYTINLTAEEKRKVLPAVNLIKEKQNSNIKGQKCANGSKQRQYMKEGESVASPTASMELLPISLLIYLYKIGT